MSSQTYKEIKQQPNVWKKVINQVESEKNEWKDFWNKYQNYKIIFTGAGTSEFIGNALVGFCRERNINAESISSTNIVSAPAKHLLNEPTVLVSFARSGNSPESLGAVSLANSLIDEIEHIFITCNAAGELYLTGTEQSNVNSFLLPEEANDQGFAMTSSYSGMMMAALNLILLKENKFKPEALSAEVDAFEMITPTLETAAQKILLAEFERLVYLGCGIYQAFAQEGRLKFLELTQGLVPTFFDNTLSFRHGPKSILNQTTTTILLLSPDPYERKYDLDLLWELKAQKQSSKLIVLDAHNDESLKEICDYISLNDVIEDEIIIGLAYMYFLQLLALNKSIQFGFNPDNPCPSGEVNRVVQGVSIYPYE